MAYISKIKNILHNLFELIVLISNIFWGNLHCLNVKSRSYSKNDFESLSSGQHIYMCQNMVILLLLMFLHFFFKSLAYLSYINRSSICTIQFMDSRFVVFDWVILIIFNKTSQILPNAILKLQFLAKKILVELNSTFDSI